MAGVYKFGFDETEPIPKAKEQALAHIRKDDPDPVFTPPQVIQSHEHSANGEYVIRVVTGDFDPLIPKEGE